MKKRGFVDSVRVKDPCTQAWDEMIGNDKVRFCTHCAKDVNNLSAMTRKEALRLVRKSGGSLCIRYVPQPQTRAPMFAEQLTQITRRRAPLMAAGVMSASLSLATLTYAQGGSVPEKESPAAARVSECEDVSKLETKAVNEGVLVLRGTIIDPLGAVISTATVSLLSDGKIRAQTATNDEGVYRLDGIAAGSYQLTATSGGFANYALELTINEAVAEHTADITLEFGAMILGDIAITTTEYEGALAMAVANEDLEAAKDLIVRGENVNRKEDDGTTPLHIAVEHGNLQIAELLLNFGAKVNARNKERETPLMNIDEDSSLELVQLLLRYGAKVNQVAKDGNTPLIRAARNSKAEVIKALVDAAARLDVQNEKGITALMEAADADNLENARVLVLAGANVNLKDKEGETAWNKTNDDELEDLLEIYGAVID